MFGFSKIKRPNTCPVAEDNRIWLENAFLLLLDFFGKENTRQRKILIPHHSCFPIRYNGDEQTAVETLKIIALQMEVPFEQIQLDFYNENAKEVSTGSPFGQGIYLKAEKDDSGAAGLYWGKGDDGKYNISLVRSKLKQPENMVATLAHEIAHIKLLGENRIDKNDEKLTDLTTVFFGLGIFNANAAFQTYRGVDYRGWRKMGYLTQMEWGYALSLLAHVRKEKTPEWINHLTINIKGDFIQGQNFIENNPEQIFQT
ncbi:hypothetical protein [Ferruginibacter sp. SUN106]|uniref:hypothetical protein n=1 Tax=Ferruginibacter sp. SUN106 TaxID=2978348 RepID=UPI003D361CAE